MWHDAARQNVAAGRNRETMLDGDYRGQADGEWGAGKGFTAALAMGNLPHSRLSGNAAYRRGEDQVVSMPGTQGRIPPWR